MRRSRLSAVASKIIALGTSAALGVCGSNGCATMAHTVDPGGLHMRKTEKCDGLGDVCPWFAADFAWLLAGVVPGIVALAVDFGTGAWKHANLGGSTSSAQDKPRDVLSRVRLCFSAERIAMAPRGEGRW